MLLKWFQYGPPSRTSPFSTMMVPNGSGSSFAAGLPSYRKSHSLSSSYFRPACPGIAGKRW